MAVMRTQDIVRLADIFSDLREKSGKPYLLAGPVYDDLYNATEGNPTIKNRRVGVREMGVYGQDFNHVFFQRYGYTIPGYGTIADSSPLRTSEFTHHQPDEGPRLKRILACHKYYWARQSLYTNAIAPDPSERQIWVPSAIHHRQR